MATTEDEETTFVVRIGEETHTKMKILAAGTKGKNLRKLVEEACILFLNSKK